MKPTKLTRRCVEKVWGRRDLPAMFDGAYSGEQPVGEIWFEHPQGGDGELLVKYLFTSEKLSIQVHPEDNAARRAGQPRGKDEAWLLLDAEPDGHIGIGLKRELSRDELLTAARDGSIEDLLDWRLASAGDFYYSPAGTVHALGPGLSLIEIQQNSDVTYRLFDYGRPRELHVDAAVEVARAGPYQPTGASYSLSDGREILAEGQAFVLERWRGPKTAILDPAEGRPVWLVPTQGAAAVAGQAIEPGEVWLVESAAPIALEPLSELLVAYPGAAVQPGLAR